MAHLSRTPAVRTAVLDAAHLGDIHGALGTIPHGARSARSWRAHLRTLAAIVGPGLIVMVGDNDAGAFATYSQAGQNYGTTLLWTLLLLVPVLYVNQEMVLRLGAVTGVGHARLILERFGRFWGAFSVIDLFVLNGLTIVTEFIGISIALEYLGIPKLLGVVAAAALTIMAASTGDFRRFERFSLILERVGQRVLSSTKFVVGCFILSAEYETWLHAPHSSSEESALRRPPPTCPQATSQSRCWSAGRRRARQRSRAMRLDLPFAVRPRDRAPPRLLGFCAPSLQPRAPLQCATGGLLARLLG